MSDYNNYNIILGQGQVGITLNSGWSEPQDPYNPHHIEASERALQFDFGWFASPVMHGDYPDVMKWRVGNNSIIQNLPKSRLPEFTDDQKAFLKGKLIDFV